MGTFGTVYALLLFFSGSEDTPYVSYPFSGYSDMYFRDEELGKAYLVRPAEGMWKGMKMISYFAEFGVAMSILLSHLVVSHFFSRKLKNDQNVLRKSVHANDGLLP